jgi:hypothetical protein
VFCQTARLGGRVAIYIFKKFLELSNSFIPFRLVLSRFMVPKIILRFYATSRNIADSNPEEIIVFFNLRNTSIHTMAVGLTDRSKYQEFSWSEGRQAGKDDDL